MKLEHGDKYKTNRREVEEKYLDLYGKHYATSSYTLMQYNEACMRLIIMT
jgi:hypothetical protein